MGVKKWYKSTGVWAGIVGVLVAVYNAAQASLVGGCGFEGELCVTLPVIPEFIYGILAALGWRGRVKASTKIG